MRRRVLLAVAILVAGAGSGFAYLSSRSPAEREAIRVSGNIEVTDAEVSFRIPGRIQSRPVSEGGLIERGAAVAFLDASDLVGEVAMRRAELRSAQARLAELEAGSRREEIARATAAVQGAQARLAELEAGSRPQEVAAAAAAVAKAKAEGAMLEADFRRKEELHGRGVLSTQELDDAMGLREMAAARLREAEERLALVEEGPRREAIDQARASLSEAREALNLVKAGPRAETIEAARADLERAREALALAETRLGYATLLSPLSGVVLSEHVEPGEYIAAGTPVVTVGDMENVWLRAYVNETDLGRVKAGQRVLVTADTYPGKRYEGRLSFISSQAEFTPRNVQTTKERVKLVYRVKVDIPNPSMELKPGMPADAEILIEPREPREPSDSSESRNPRNPRNPTNPSEPRESSKPRESAAMAEELSMIRE